MDLDRILFSLDAARFEQFTALLNAPPGPDAGLKRLRAVRPPWAADSESALVDG